MNTITSTSRHRGMSKMRRKKAELILHSIPLILNDGRNNDDGAQAGVSVKRVAVIDACNVLHTCAGLALNCDPSVGTYNRVPDAIGLLLVAYELLSEGIDVRVVISASYMKKQKVENYFILEQMEQLGLLTVVPYWNHDDLRILEMAAKTAGFVVSNDKYYDHVISGQLDNSTLAVIRSRMLTYAFSRVQSSGKERGFEFISERRNRLLSANIQLKFTEEDRHVMYARSDDWSYSTALEERFAFSTRKATKCVQCLSLIFDYIQQNFCIMLDLCQPKLSFFHPKFEELPLKFAQFKQLQQNHSESEEIWRQVNATSTSPNSLTDS